MSCTYIIKLQEKSGCLEREAAETMESMIIGLELLDLAVISPTQSSAKTANNQNQNTIESSINSYRIIKIDETQGLKVGKYILVEVQLPHVTIYLNIKEALCLSWYV